MSNTVGQYQQAAFTSPAYGDSPISSSVVRGNDNSVATNYNSHDSDPTIHVQQSAVGARPAFGAAGRIWFTSDTYELAYDTGAAWQSVKVSAANVTAGTFPAGTFTFSGDVVVTGALSGNGILTFGDATTDTITFTARVAAGSSLKWNTDGNGSIGAAGANRPASVYVADSVPIGSYLTIGRDGQVGTYTFITDGVATLGSTDTILMGYGGTPRFRFTGMGSTAPVFAPYTDLQGDLGISGTNRWKNIYSQYFTANSSGIAVTGAGNFTTTLAVGAAAPAGAEIALIKQANGATAPAARLWNNANGAGDNQFVEFATETAITIRGSIDYNRGGGLTRYNTTSDVRLKRDIVDAPDAGALIDRVRVRSFGWKDGDAYTQYGFVAQELVQVAPDAVSVGDDGETIVKTWGVDPSKLVPMLVKELQALRRRVDALEALVVP